MAHALRDYPLEVVHYATGELRLVHRIDVNMVDAIRKKVDDLLGRIRDARAEHRSRVVAEPVDDCAEARRKMRSRKFAYPGDLPPVSDRHDAGDDRNRYARVAETRKDHVVFLGNVSDLIIIMIKEIAKLIIIMFLIF